MGIDTHAGQMIESAPSRGIAHRAGSDVVWDHVSVVANDRNQFISVIRAWSFARDTPPRLPHEACSDVEMTKA